MANHEQSWGVAKPDPLDGPKNFQLTVSSTRFAVEEIASANHGLISLVAFKGALLTVSLRDADEHQTLGSAVLVHPGIAVTAKHVVADWLVKIGSGRAGAVCQAPTADGLLLWDVVSIHSLDNADIALPMLRFRAELPPLGTFVVNSVTTRMPSVGDRVFLAGFTANQLSLPASPQIEIEGFMRVSIGKVIDVWPNGRDRVMLPSSSFAVDCPALGGMSGGPVFDADGRALGIVCSSPSEGDAYACVSHIWPALLTGVQPVWPLPLASTTLLHMGRRHGVDIHGPDAFKFRLEGDQLVIAYEPWS